MTDNDKFDVLGAIVDRPTAEKFRQMCRPNTAEEVIETFIQNVIKSGVNRYDCTGPNNFEVKGKPK